MEEERIEGGSVIGGERGEERSFNFMAFVY